MKFYTVKKHEAAGQNICLVDDQTERLWLYVPNFGTFHHDNHLEDSFYFPDPVNGSDLTFEEITAAQAADIASTLDDFDIRNDVQRRLLNEYESQLFGKDVDISVHPYRLRQE